jgi:hypothetical protein
MTSTAMGAINLKNLNFGNLTNVSCTKFPAGACVELTGTPGNPPVFTQWITIVNLNTFGTKYGIQTTNEVSGIFTLGGVIDCINMPGSIIASSIGIDLGKKFPDMSNSNGGENHFYGTHINNCATGVSVFNSSNNHFNVKMESNPSVCTVPCHVGFLIDGSGGFTVGNRIESTVVKAETAIRLKANAVNTVLSGVTLALNTGGTPPAVDLDIDAMALASTRIFGGVGSGTGGAFITATASPSAPVTGHVIPGDVRTGNSGNTDFAGELAEGVGQNFSGSYSTAPVCVATDTNSSPAAASALVTGTAPTFKLTIESTATSHHFYYVCVGRN